MPDERSDEAVAVLVQNGDAESFGILMERYEEKLLRYGRKFLSDREDVKDIVHDVFLQSYKNLKSFDAKQRFSPWIYRIAHNAFVNELRRKSRRPFALPDFDSLLSYAVYEDPAEAERERADMRQMAEQGLSMLKASEREILILFYMEELSYKEIAEVLKMPMGTVSVRLSRAKKALRAAYDSLNISV